MYISGGVLVCIGIIILIGPLVNALGEALDEWAAADPSVPTRAQRLNPDWMSPREWIVAGLQTLVGCVCILIVLGTTLSLLFGF